MTQSKYLVAGCQRHCRFRVALLALMLCTALPAAAAEDTDEDRARFRTCYNSFQEAVNAQRWHAARVHATTCNELAPKIYGEEHPNTAAMQLNYARMLLFTQNRQEALPAATRANTLYRNLYGSGSIEVIDSLMLLGDATTLGADPERARRHYREAVNIARRNTDPDADLAADLQILAGSSLMNNVNADIALEFFEDALKHFSRVHGQTHLKTAMANFQIGKVYLARRNNRRALEFFDAALETYTALGESGTQMAMITRGFLVEVNERAGNSDAATEHVLAIGRATPRNPSSSITPLYQPIELPHQANRGGYALIEFTIDTEGRVKDPVVIEYSGGRGHATASMRAMRNWRFAPHFVDGQPVEVKNARYKIVYEMRPEDAPPTGSHIRR